MFKIFILEDNHERIEWFKDMFKGNELDITKNAKKAIKQMSKNRYDIIFLDHDLGEEDLALTGREVARQMKKRKIARDTPVVLHSKNPHNRRKMLRHLLEYKKDIVRTIYSDLRKYTLAEIYEKIRVKCVSKKVRRKFRKTIRNLVKDDNSSEIKDRIIT
jgi:CheY-like chemotaxis protein